MSSVPERSVSSIGNGILRHGTVDSYGSLYVFPYYVESMSTCGSLMGEVLASHPAPLGMVVSVKGLIFSDEQLVWSREVQDHVDLATVTRHQPEDARIKFDVTRKDGLPDNLLIFVTSEDWTDKLLRLFLRSGIAEQAEVKVVQVEEIYGTSTSKGAVSHLHGCLAELLASRSVDL